MKVVIVGGGFGGVRAALKLANKRGIEVRLISKQSYFEYHAALYRSATGRSPLEVAIPLREFFAKKQGVEFIEDEIVSLHEDQKYLLGKSESKYHYDYVIFSMGAVSQYFGIDGLKEYSEGIKTIQEALELKRHLHEALISHEKPELNYVVVGGGPSGIELAGELPSYLQKIRRNHHVRHKKFNVDLVEASPQLLPQLPARFANKIEKRLARLGVSMYLNTAVKSETAQSLSLPNGSIRTHTVIWTAGTTNNPFYASNRVFKLTKGNKVVVDDYLRVNDEIFVIGDSAATKYSGMAQTALHDADFVANNLLRRLRNKPLNTYVPKAPVHAIPVGPRWSAVKWGSLEIYGRLGWLLRRAADLRLYLEFMPLKSALAVWHYGLVPEEVCRRCK